MAASSRVRTCKRRGGSRGRTQRLRGYITISRQEGRRQSKEKKDHYYRHLRCSYLGCHAWLAGCRSHSLQGTCRVVLSSPGESAPLSLGARWVANSRDVMRRLSGRFISVSHLIQPIVHFDDDCVTLITAHTIRKKVAVRRTRSSAAARAVLIHAAPRST